MSIASLPALSKQNKVSLGCTLERRSNRWSEWTPQAITRGDPFPAASLSWSPWPSALLGHPVVSPAALSGCPLLLWVLTFMRGRGELPPEEGPLGTENTPGRRSRRFCPGAVPAISAGAFWAASSCLPPSLLHQACLTITCFLFSLQTPFEQACRGEHQVQHRSSARAMA